MSDTKELNPVINRALLIGVQNPRQYEHDAQSLLDELTELVGTLEIGIVDRKLIKIRERNARFLLGNGKAAEVVKMAQELKADSIIFDEELTPAQQRNWEAEAGGKLLVIDRQEIILDIFNQRAHTKEASLQVELARLEYNLPRMKRAWTHLDRQRGGGAMQRDSGEKQIEIDQRLIRNRIARLKTDLKDVIRHRQVQRKKRMTVPLPTAAIVGYTNAGKSSLLNLLTHSEVLAEDKLFATLDPTTRRMELPSGQSLLMTDTVGFVRRLPHRLVEAFKATLEEALVATFLIHVVDASSPDAEQHYKTTLEVLSELDAKKKNIITVFNKIDLLDGQTPPLHLAQENSATISTKTGEGIPEFLAQCEAMLSEFGTQLDLVIPHDRYDLVGRLHKLGAVTEEKHEEDGVHISGNIPSRILQQVQPFIA